MSNTITYCGYETEVVSFPLTAKQKRAFVRSLQIDPHMTPSEIRHNLEDRNKFKTRSWLKTLAFGAMYGNCPAQRSLQQIPKFGPGNELVLNSFMLETWPSFAAFTRRYRNVPSST